MDLSVIIVAYKNQDKLRTTLRSVFRSVTIFTQEVFVVDNDSGDGTYEMVQREFPQVKLIHNENNGFSKANNIAIKQSSGRIVLLLNPDTELETNTLEQCIKRIDQDPQIGVLGCKLLKGDGKLDLASRRMFPNPTNSFFRLTGLAKIFPRIRFISNYNLTYLPEDQETEIDSVVGAFLMIKREVIDKIGLLDEDFFMYGEDLDWCWRTKEAGYKVWYYPKVICHHYKGSSSSKAPYLALHAFYDAMWIFYKKHYARNNFFLFNWLVWLGIWSRFSLYLLRNALKKDKFVSR